MKKIFGLIISLSIIFLISGNVFASGSGTTTTGGATVTIGTDGTDPGDALVFNPSPQTCMKWAVSTNAYTILSWSPQNYGQDTGMMYMVSTSENGVFQKKIGTTAPSDSLTAGTTLTGWTAK